MSIGQQLRNERMAQGISVRRMAELARTSPTTVQNVENGEHSPSIDIVSRMADVLGLTIEVRKA